LKSRKQRKERSGMQAYHKKKQKKRKKGNAVVLPRRKRGRSRLPFSAGNRQRGSVSEGGRGEAASAVHRWGVSIQLPVRRKMEGSGSAVGNERAREKKRKNGPKESFGNVSKKCFCADGSFSGGRG